MAGTVAAPRPAKPSGYDVFLSYSTDPDYPLSRTLEKFLETFHRLKTPDGRPLPRLEVCRDGSDFSAHQSNRRGAGAGRGVVEELIITNLESSRYLLVLCSRRTPLSRYVGMEVQWFLEHRGEDAILLAVTEGDDPAGRPEEVFPPSIIERGLHKRPFFDLRGHRRKGAAIALKVRDLEEEMTNVAAHLHEDTGGRLMPIWQRETLRRARRQRLVLAGIVLSLLAITGNAVYQRQRLESSNVALERAKATVTATAVGIADLQTRGGRVRDSLLSLTQLMRETPGSAAVRNRVVDQLLRRPWAVPIATFKSPAPIVDSDCQRHRPACVLALEGGQLMRWDARAAAARPPETFGQCPGRVIHVVPSDNDEYFLVSCDSRLQRWSTPPSNVWKVDREWQLERPIAAIAVNFLASVVVAQDDAGILHVWNPSKPKQEHTYQAKSGYVPTWIALDRQGENLMAGSFEGRVTLWNTNKQSERILRQLAQAGGFSNDGLYLATVTAGDRVARLWRPFNEHLDHTLVHPGAPVGGFAFSSDSKRVATSTDDGVLWVWDIQAIKAEVVSSMPHGLGIGGMTFSTNNNQILTIGDLDAYAWDVASGRLLGEMRVGDQISMMPVSDGQILTIGNRNDVHLWQLKAARELTLALHHGGPVDRVQFIDGGNRIMSVFRDKNAKPKEGDPAAWPKIARRWSFAASTPFDAYDNLERESAPMMAIADEGRRVVAGQSAEGRRAFAELEDLSGPATRTIGIVEASSDITSIAFSGDGRRFVTVDWKGSIAVWNGLDAKPVGHPVKGLEAGSAALSWDGDWLVTANEQSASIWKVGDVAPTGAPLSESLGITAVTFNRQGTRVATVSGYHVSIWSVSDHRRETRLDHPANVTSAAFSADGASIVTTCNDGTARLWDVETGQALRDPLRHPTPLLAADLSPDGKRLVTGGEDGLVRIWDLVETRPEDAGQLSDLVEATVGFRVGTAGQMVAIADPSQARSALRQRAAADISGPLSRFISWYLDDSDTRTISPSSALKERQWRTALSAPDEQALRGALASLYPGAPTFAAPPVPAPAAEGARSRQRAVAENQR